MSADRELLELAAKAAGYEGTVTMYPSGYAEMGLSNTHSPSGSNVWKPLYDDGDALRLAMKLDIDLRFDEVEQVVEARHQATSYGEHEEYGADKCAATRRAIVRAAAEIGRTI